MLSRPTSVVARCLSYATLLCCVCGCGYFHNLTTADRLQNGYTIVLPGIESSSVFNSNIAQGLHSAGVDTAIEVYDWTTGTVVNFVYHLRHLERNRRQAQVLAEKIVAYQDRYPGRPVYLIGHSGGGGLALLTLQSLPSDRTVTGVILLAPAVSPHFDLTPALHKTEAGIWNFYSGLDAFFLVAGTTLLGTIDGEHVPSAGAVGFRVPPEPTGPQTTQVYQSKLHQVRWDLSMVKSGNLGGHFGSTWLHFSRDALAPLIQSAVARSSAEPAAGTANRSSVVNIDDYSESH